MSEMKAKLHTGELYFPGDEEIMKEQMVYQDLLCEYNQTKPSEREKRAELLKKMLGDCGEGIYIEAPFYANFGGHHCHFGKQVYANYHLTCVDDTHIYIGDYTMIGPNVTIATAGHPILLELREKGLQYNMPVHIGRNCWIGAGVIIVPGVTVGDNVVIGAGSIVTKDIPSNVVAAGNPCRILREVDERDRKYYFKEREIHPEAWKEMTEEGNNMTANMEEPGGEENLAWEEIRTEHIVQDEWIDFRRSAYRFPDGSVFEPYYSYSRRDYVVIVASDEEGKYLCVRQFRQGIKKVTTEFPAGGIERTDGRQYGAGRDASAAEDALEAARRELLEETGYVSDDLRHLLTVPSNATISDNYAHIFVARNCRRAGEQKLDETEFLNVRKYSAAEIEEMIDRGDFPQAVHIMAWLLAKRG